MQKLIVASLFSFFGFVAISCNTVYQSQAPRYKEYRVTSLQANNKDMLALLQPYRDSVNKSMNDIVGIATKTMEKKMPEGALGNFIADAVLKMATEKFNTAVDIKDNKAVHVMIGGKPLDRGGSYTIVSSDYVANGGNNADMLRPLAQHNIGYMMRDALFDYIAGLKSQGKNISANEENRVSYAQ